MGSPPTSPYSFSITQTRRPASDNETNARVSRLKEKGLITQTRTRPNTAKASSLFDIHTWPSPENLVDERRLPGPEESSEH